MMGSVQAITSCLRKCATFSGRASRSEFWWFALFLGVTIVTLRFLDVVLWGWDLKQQNNPALLTRSFAIIAVLPLLAAASRRLADAGFPSALVVLPFLGTWLHQQLFGLYLDSYRAFGANSASINPIRTIVQYFDEAFILMSIVLLLLPTGFVDDVRRRERESEVPQ